MKRLPRPRYPHSRGHSHVCRSCSLIFSTPASQIPSGEDAQTDAGSDQALCTETPRLEQWQVQIKHKIRVVWKAKTRIDRMSAGETIPKVSKRELPRCLSESQSVCLSMSFLPSNERERKKETPDFPPQFQSVHPTPSLSLSPSLYRSPSAPPSLQDRCSGADRGAHFHTTSKIWRSHACKSSCGFLGDVSPHCAACNKSVHHFCAMIQVRPALGYRILMCLGQFLFMMAEEEVMQMD